MINGIVNKKLPIAWMAVVLLGLAIDQASAQVKPFKVKGSGVIIEDLFPVAGAAAPHIAIGQATHLGKYTGAGVVQIETLDLSDLSGTFFSAVPFVFEAANGDKLAFQYGRTDEESGAAPPAAKAGEITFVITDHGQLVAVWDAEFNPVPALCTGRFENVVAGSFRMLAVTDPFDFGPLQAGLAYSWTGEGWIQFKKKGKN
jgi:hypothetical protein